MNNMTWNENLEFPTNIINLLIPIFKNTSWKFKNGENTFIFGIQTDKGIYKIEIPLEYWNKFEVDVVSEIELNKEIGERLYLGIVGDTDRFLHDYTSSKTFGLVNKLIDETNINFTELYKILFQCYSSL